MASILTCDHCHQPITDRSDAVNIHIINPAKLGMAPPKGEGSLAKRAQAAAASAATLTKQPAQLDLHIRCFDAVLVPALERIGKP